MHGVGGAGTDFSPSISGLPNSGVLLEEVVEVLHQELVQQMEVGGTGGSGSSSNLGSPRTAGNAATNTGGGGGGGSGCTEDVR